MPKLATAPVGNDLYGTDFYAWTRQQAEILRERRWDDLDLENLIEEIQSLGISNKREIESRLLVLIAHLLKWAFQPGARCSSWSASIREQRSQIRRLIKHSPSLKRYPAKVFLEEYPGARLEASDQTGIALELLPAECPFSIDEILDADFMPDEPGHLGK